MTATVAPAFAASQCNGFVGPSAAGWTVSKTNVSANGGTDAFTTNGYSVVQDPGSTAAASITVTTNQPVRFLAGTTYTFTFSFTTYTQNPRSLVFNLQVNGVNVAGTNVTTATTTAASPRSATFTPTSSGCFPVALSFVFGNENSLVGDDITINNLARSPA